MKRWEIFILLICCLVLSCERKNTTDPKDNVIEWSEHFLSIDVNSNNLVLISANDDSAYASVIGPIGCHLADPDLTWLNDNLYVLNTKEAGGTELLMLNPETGVIIDSIEVTHDGAPVMRAEALCEVGGALRIGASLNGFDSSSESLGKLSVNGVISEVVSYAPMDFDGMDAFSVDTVLAIDVNPSVHTTYLTVSIDDSLVNILFNCAPAEYRTNDIALIGDRAYGVRMELIVADLIEGTCWSVPIEPRATYSGLVRAECPRGDGESRMW